MAKKQIKTKKILMLLLWILLPLMLLYLLWQNGKVKTMVSKALHNGEDIYFLKDFKLRTHDAHGSGAYGATRSGGKTHLGADVIFRKGQEVKAPFECIFVREGQVYSGDAKYRLIELEGTKGYFKGYKMKIMYCTKVIEPSTVVLAQHTLLAKSQDISEKYSGITPHLHIEMWDASGNRVNPEKFH